MAAEPAPWNNWSCMPGPSVTTSLPVTSGRDHKSAWHEENVYTDFAECSLQRETRHLKRSPFQETGRRVFSLAAASVHESFVNRCAILMKSVLSRGAAQICCGSVLLASIGFSAVLPDPRQTLTQLLADDSRAGRAEDLVVHARHLGDDQVVRFARDDCLPSQIVREQASIEHLATAEDLHVAVIGGRTIPRLLRQQIFDVPAILRNHML